MLLYLPFTLCFFLSAVRVPTPNAWPGATRSYAWLFAVLVLLNGLCPWLGIKDRNSWQMYSNLRLEPGASNHWIIPRSLDLLGLQSDTVQVQYVSYGYLNTVWTSPDVEVRWYMLRWHAWQDPAMAISYRRDGVTHEAATVAEDPLLTPPSWPLRKISWFRPAGPPVAEQCQW